MYEDLNSEFKYIETVFLDCFDTLLYRNSSPEKVMDRWLAVLSDQLEISKEELKKIWNIVSRIKRPNSDERSFLAVCDDFYNRIYYCKGFDKSRITRDNFKSCLVENYLAVELSVLKVNRELVEKIRPLKSIRGKKIYLVSDFYMPKQFFENVFKKLDIYNLFDEIIVSSEIGYRKSTGNLYKWILREYNLNPENILMIGDNKNSDIFQAHRLGIKTYRIKSIHKTKPFSPYKEIEKKFEENLKIDPLSNYAFSLYLFLYEIKNYVRKNNVKDIYFCSREGEYFKKEFDKFNQDEKVNVKTHYLLVSRKATFLPSLNPLIEEESFSTLRNSSPNISISTFIDTLGLDLDCLEDINFKDINRIIPNFFESDEYKKIKENSLFCKKYNYAVLNAKKEFWNYLSTLGISKQTSSITLVDIGWRGTIQDHLSSFFGNSIKVTGLYFGLENTSNLSASNRKIGLVYSDVPYKSQDFDVFSTNHRILERVLQASHGSADHYLNSRCILSIYEAKEKELYELTFNTKKRISQTISYLSEIWGDYPLGYTDKHDLIALLHEAYLTLYTKKFKNEENKINNLMTMTFGTRNEGVSYKSFLKKIYKMPKVEKKNKFLKMFRKCHLNLFVDMYIVISLKLYRRKILRMYE